MDFSVSSPSPSKSDNSDLMAHLGCSRFASSVPCFPVQSLITGVVTLVHTFDGYITTSLSCWSSYTLLFSCSLWSTREQSIVMMGTTMSEKKTCVSEDLVIVQDIYLPKAGNPSGSDSLDNPDRAPPEILDRSSKYLGGPPDGGTKAWSVVLGLGFPFVSRWCFLTPVHVQDFTGHPFRVSVYYPVFLRCPIL